MVIGSAVPVRSWRSPHTERAPGSVSSWAMAAWTSHLPAGFPWSAAQVRIRSRAVGSPHRGPPGEALVAHVTNRWAVSPDGDRLGHAELRGQVSPGAAGGQDVDDRGEHRSVIDVPGAATLRALGLRRKQWLDDLPQPVGDQFLAQSFPHERGNGGHSSAHPRKTSSKVGVAGLALSAAKEGIARLLPLGDDGSEAHHALLVDLFRGCHG